MKEALELIDARLKYLAGMLAETEASEAKCKEVKPDKTNGFGGGFFLATILRLRSEISMLSDIRTLTCKDSKI